MPAPDPVARWSPVLRVALATLAGAAGGLAAFAAGWSLLIGAAPSLLGWLVGGVAAGFLGSEVGCRAAVALTPDDPNPPAGQADRAVAVPRPEADGRPAESLWRDRVRADTPSRTPPRR